MKAMESNEQSDRLPRFVRHRHRKPALVLQERDRELVRVVAQHRVISSDNLQLLIGGSNQTILRRLQKLFHNGYLDRPTVQRIRGNAPMVYALGQKGAELVALEAGAKTAGDWPEKNRLLGPTYLEHALMVSRFQTAMRVSLRERGNASLDRWRADGAIRDSVVVEHEASTERIPIAPDAFFTLRLLNEPEGRNRVHVFLEADRGTMTTKRFFVKMRGYWHWWRSGRQERLLGIRNFLVLTVTLTTERAASLCAVTGELDAPRHRGLRMFLFGSERSSTPGAPERILDAVWSTPEDQSRHSLLE
jgi:hypothetical protein